MEICGLDCCRTCSKAERCGGCEACGGHPLGGDCVAAQTISAEGQEGFAALQETLLREINALGIPGLRAERLFLLNGDYVNLEDPLANGAKAKFLRENNVYLGAQVEREGSERCYGVVANRDFLLVCSYGCDGADPELLLFKKRERRAGEGNEAEEG